MTCPLLAKSQAPKRIHTCEAAPWAITPEPLLSPSNLNRKGGPDLGVWSSLMTEELRQGPRVVKVAFAEPFLVRSRDSLVDKDEREHARGNGEGRAHAQGEAVAVGEGGRGAAVGAGLGRRDGEQRSDADRGAYLPSSVDERAGQPLLVVRDACGPGDGGGEDGARRAEPHDEKDGPEQRIAAGGREPQQEGQAGGGQGRARREKPLDAQPGDDRRSDDATQQARDALGHDDEPRLERR